MSVSNSSEMTTTVVKIAEVPTNSDLSSWERRFEKKVFAPTDNTFMQAFTLLNGISVLYCCADAVPNGDVNVESIAYSSKVASTTSNLSGKRKKGAIKIMRGDVLCHLLLSDGTKVHLRSPIAGQIVEINDLLNANTDLLRSENGDGYMLVMLRNKMMELTSSTKSKHNVCHNFLKGACKFGDKCKFKHVTPDAATIVIAIPGAELDDGEDDDDDDDAGLKKAKTE
jgi:hypothetical protein